GGLGQRADRLVMAGVADVEDRVALPGPHPGLVVDLGDQRADGIDHEPALLPGGGHHIGRRAVGREHHRGSVGDVVDAVDEDHAQVPEPVDHQPDVDDLVVAVDRRLEHPDHPGQDLDRHIHASAEPPGAGQQPLFDRVRTCDNHCPFCFIYQLPKGMRKSLYVKDDDYRLSFLYGNFTTLTRFTEADLERVVDEGLGPLYVSIHSTDPDLWSRLLRNRRGATSLRWLRLLLDHGVEVHGQVVVCPGLNDGPALEETFLGVLDRFPELASVGVVPLGVSDHNTEPDMRAHAPGEAAAVMATIDRWQRVFLDVLGRRMVFAADEYLLMAGRPFPETEEYEGFPQHENGIGMARTFYAEVQAALAGAAVPSPAAAPTWPPSSTPSRRAGSATCCPT